MRKRKSEGNNDKWFTMPRSLFKQFTSVLGINTVAVYCLLAAYADNHYKTRLTFPKISQKLGCTNSEAIRALHLLEDFHLIRSEPIVGRTKMYQLLWVPPWGKLWGKMKEKSGPYRIDYSINNKYDIDGLINKIILNQNMNQTEETLFAYELADALNDREAIQMYISYVHRFSESLLREILTKVLSVPDSKIRKTRGALFNYLIQQHAAKAKYYPRN